MKGFTILEASYVILILSILFISVFYGYSFRKEFFYLKNFIKNFRLAFETSVDMSQRAVFKDNYLFCGYGLYFPDNTHYETLGFYTTSTECDFVFQDESRISSFINKGLNNKYFVTYYGDLSTTSNPKIVLLSDFKGSFSFSTSTPDCSHSIINPPIILLSIYSTSEFYLFLRQPNWQRMNINYLYICLSYKNERKVLKLNKLGQIIIVR